MQETLSICFGLKIRNTTFHQVDVSKNECRKVTSMFMLSLRSCNCATFLFSYFYLTEDHFRCFRLKTFFENFLHLMALIWIVFKIHFLKQQFMVLFVVWYEWPQWFNYRTSKTNLMLYNLRLEISGCSFQHTLLVFFKMLQ